MDLDTVAPLRLITATLPSLAENLALDEALLQQCEAELSPGYLRLWEWEPLAVVLGSSSRIQQEVCVDLCLREGVEIRRRSSGGGVVLLGRGCLLFSLIRPVPRPGQLPNITATAQEIMGTLRSSLLPLQSGIEVSGTSDLTLAGQKFSGNSQRWLKQRLLHHGTLLYEFPLEQISRCLDKPRDEPDYRQQRSHAEFVRNLPLTKSQLTEALLSAWPAEVTGEPLPLDHVQRLVADRFGREEWVRRL